MVNDEVNNKAINIEKKEKKRLNKRDEMSRHLREILGVFFIKKMRNLKIYQ